MPLALVEIVKYWFSSKGGNINRRHRRFTEMNLSGFGKQSIVLTIRYKNLRGFMLSGIVTVFLSYNYNMKRF